MQGEHVSIKLRYITTWKTECKVQFGGNNWLFENFGSLYNFIFTFFMNNVSNQNGRVLEKMLADSNLDAVKTTLREIRDFKMVFRMDFKKPSRHSSITLSHA